MSEIARWTFLSDPNQVNHPDSNSHLVNIDRRLNNMFRRFRIVPFICCWIMFFQCCLLQKMQPDYLDISEICNLGISIRALS